MSRSGVVTLFDVDNTLLDNDHIVADMRRHLGRTVGDDAAETVLGAVRAAATGAGVRRLPGRPAAVPDRGSAPSAPARGLHVPRWATRSPTDSSRAHWTRSSTRAPGAGRHPLRRRRRVPAAQGAALGPVRGGRGQRPHLRPQGAASWETSSARFPADHYVFVDDKPRLCTAIKAHWGDARHHRVPASGSLRARRCRASPRSRRPTSPSSASASSSAWISRPCAGRAVRRRRSRTG